MSGRCGRDFRKQHENLERALEFILPILKDRGEFEKIG
jgi:hypothetical protein